MVPVQEGVWWLRMPLPISLDHINLWLLEDGGGYALVDTGMATDAARETWDHLARTVLVERPLTRILLTHLHPDHAGLAACYSDGLRYPCGPRRPRSSSCTCCSARPASRLSLTDCIFRRPRSRTHRGDARSGGLEGLRDSVDGVPASRPADARQRF
ncbi:MAG: MBL fold metallo-hydrolase [Steroidobacteraceae bacterium]